MKKVWAVLLAAALLLALAAPAVAADTVASGACGDDLTWTLDSEGKLTISGTGEMWDFAFIGAMGENIIRAPWNSWYFENSYPNPTAEIQPGVTSVGDYAFEYPFTSVTIPASVTRIGVGAFSGTMNIQVASGNPTYSDVDGILFSRDGTVLYAYPGGRDADAYTVPDGVTSIGDRAFSACRGLRSVTIPDCVTSIGDYAFYWCWSLTDMVFPNSVTGIGDYTFCACSNLASITIPDSVESIGGSAFAACEYLENIHVTNDNPFFSEQNGILFSRDAAVIYCYPNGKEAEGYTIPETVKSIGDGAFSGCQNLTSIMIPDSVTSIGDDAFFNCYNLTSITIPDGVTRIGCRAFYWCSSLTSVTIPDSVTSIGEEAFSGCGLTSVTIPNSVTSIGDYAFYWCSRLTSITIPDSVTSIGDYAFANCGCLEDIYVANSNQFFSDLDGVLFSWDATVIYCYPAGKDAEVYTIPDTVTSIGNSAFYRCYLESITIPDGVTNIGDSAFSCSSSLTSVTIPSGVTSIGDRTFYECYNLMSVSIPESVTNIGDSAFSGCSSLTSVTIPSGVTSIGDRTFYGCYNLTSVSIPESVTSIGALAFILYEGYYEGYRLTDVYYGGTQQQWDAISIATGNDELLNATIHFLGNASDAPIGPAEICGTGDSLEAWVLLSAPEDSDMTVYGAYYAVDGRLLGLTRVSVPASTNTMTSFSFADGTSLSIFATDERSGAPLCDSVTILRPGET